MLIELLARRESLCSGGRRGVRPAAGAPNGWAARKSRRGVSAVLARDSLVVAAAGSSTEEAVVAAIDQLSARLPERTDLPMPPDTTFRRDGRTIVIERPVSQTSLVLGGGSSLVLG